MGDGDDQESVHPLSVLSMEAADSRQHTPPDEEVQYTQMVKEPGKSATLLGSRRPKPKKMWQQRFVKLLVVGDSGLGKTTLVRCLLAVPGETIQLHDGSATSFKEFQKNPADFLSAVEWDDDDDHTHWVYQIQDTPGYGDDLNLERNVARVKQHIVDQNQAWLDLESSAGRGELYDKVDPRVDLCIFCLPPHRVRNIDLLFMWEISRLVPILPVVTKADTMTIKECLAYRNELHRKLEHPCLPARRGSINVFQFSDETLMACGLQESAIATAAVVRPPYLVVCSNSYNKERLAQKVPELWPERVYMWGTCEAMNSRHSDLLLLRKLLLQEGVEEISRSKISRYEAWRKSEMQQIRPMRKIGGWLLTTVLVLTVAATTVAVVGRVNIRAAAEEVKTYVKTKAEEAKTGESEEGGKAAPVRATPPAKRGGLFG